MVGRAVCGLHGGLTPRGLASPHWKHGRYSRDLPSRLAARYIEARDDPDALDLLGEIAMIDTRLGELAANLDDAGDDPAATAAAWAEVRECLQDRRRLVEAETRRRAASNGMMSVAEVTNCIAAVLSAVRDAVDDRQTLAVVIGRVEQLMNVPAGTMTAATDSAATLTP